jgi:hypothetical protein
VTLLPDGRYRLEGDRGDTLWWAMKLCRFRPGELDPYVPGLERLPADAMLPSRQTATGTTDRSAKKDLAISDSASQRLRAANSG